MADHTDYTTDGYYFEPIMNLDAATDGLEYESNLLAYCDDEEQEISDDLSIRHDVEIDPELIPTMIDDLLQIEPISMAERLEKYPEMRMLKPRRRRGAVEPVFEPPPPPTTAQITTIQKDVGQSLEEAILNNNGKRTGGKRQPPQCRHCLHCFRTETALTNHLKRHLEDLPILESSFVCPMEFCDIRCDSQSVLLDHLRFQHGQDDLHEQTLYFPSWTLFEKWKEGIEEATGSRFVRVNGRVNASGKSCRFGCYFSPSYNRPKSRGIRKKTSRKMAKMCTAYLSVQETFGKVKVRACLKHIGHDKEIQHLPLSAPIKREIATLIMQGMSGDEIAQTMRANYTPDDRRYFVQEYEVKNVCSKLIKNQYRPMGIKTEVVDEIPDDLARDLEENPENAQSEVQKIKEIPPFVAEEEVVV